MDRAVLFSSEHSFGSELNRSSCLISDRFNSDIKVSIERYRISMLLFVTWLTDYFSSVDFGFHVAAVPACDRESLSKFNSWRASRHLPVRRRRNVSLECGGICKQYIIVIMTGKRYGFEGSDAADYEKLTAEAFRDSGIADFRFFPCVSDNACNCTLQIRNKKRNKNENAGSDPLNHTLRRCLAAIFGKIDSISDSCGADKTIGAILNEKMNEELKEFGSWHYSGSCGGTYTALDPGIVMQKIRNSKEPEKETADFIKCRGEICRTLRVLGNFSRNGLFFSMKYDCCRLYEQAVSNQELRNMLDFEPYTYGSMNPAALRDFDVFLSDAEFFGNLSGIHGAENIRKLFAEALVREFTLWYERKNFNTEILLKKFSDHNFKSSFEINLKNRLSENTEKISRRVSEILNFLGAEFSSGGLKLSGTFDSRKDYLDFYLRANHEGHPFFAEIENELPNYRNLHAFFRLIDETAQATGDNFIFSFDTPFSEKQVKAYYGRNKTCNEKANDLLNRGILFRSVTSKLVCGGVHVGRIYSLKGSFDCVELLK